MSIYYIRYHSVTENNLYYSVKSQYISDNSCQKHITQLSTSAVYHTVINFSCLSHSYQLQLSITQLSTSAVYHTVINFNCLSLYSFFRQWYSRDIVESGAKHHYPDPHFSALLRDWMISRHSLWLHFISKSHWVNFLNNYMGFLFVTSLHKEGRFWLI